MSPTSPTTLRPFQLADAPRIGPWFRSPGLSLPPGAAGRDWAARMLAEPRICAFVAVSGGRLVGFARLDIAPDRLAELTLVVAPGCRRTGFGRAILELVVAEAHARAVRKLCAAVDPANSIALKFFSENGFEEKSRGMVGALRLQRPLHLDTAGEPLEIDA